MNSEAPVRIESLGFSFGSAKILQDITCKFETGRIHGIIGPNGAGEIDPAEEYLPHLGAEGRADFHR